jgi:hypothetical protein
MIKRIANVSVVVALAGLIAQSAMANPDRGAPDAGAASLLLVIAVGGLAAVKRFLR